MRSMFTILAVLNGIIGVLYGYRAVENSWLPVIPDNVFGLIEYRRRIAFDVFIALLALATAVVWVSPRLLREGAMMEWQSQLQCAGIWCGWVAFWISLAVPFWFVWTRCGTGERFFGPVADSGAYVDVPDLWRKPRLRDLLGLFAACAILKLVPFWDAAGLLGLVWLLRILGNWSES